MSSKYWFCNDETFISSSCIFHPLQVNVSIHYMLLSLVWNSWIYDTNIRENSVDLLNKSLFIYILVPIKKNYMQLFSSTYSPSPHHGTFCLTSQIYTRPFLPKYIGTSKETVNWESARTTICCPGNLLLWCGRTTSFSLTTNGWFRLRAKHPNFPP